MTFFKKLKEKFFLSSWFIFLTSLFWLALRSGTKPSRIVYPCQQAAKNNLLLFGPPSLAMFYHHFIKKRKREILISGFLIFTLIIFAFIVNQNKKQQVLKSFELIKEVSSQPNNPKVVWITNNSATNGNYNSLPWQNKANQTIVNQMADEAIKALTGQNSVASAWTAIFTSHNNGADYQQGEKIAIKVNFNNNWDCDNNGCPLYQVVNALLRQLVQEKGVRQQDIGLYDVSRSFPDYFIQGVSASFPNVLLNPDHDSWPPCTVSNNVRNARFGCFLSQAKYLINMPLLRTHGMADVTLSFKNHLGSTDTPSNFHGTFFNTSASTNGLVQLNSHPFIKDKTILIFADALYGRSIGGPDGIPNLRPNSLFLSTDPVAVDSVMIDYLQNIKGDSWNNNPRLPYQLGAQAGLGNFATSCSGSNCTFTYTNINLIRCQPNCGGGSVSPSPSPSRSPSPSPTPNPSRSPSPNHSVSPSPSLTPSPSDNPCLHFNLNGDKKIDFTDLSLLLQNWSNYSNNFDLLLGILFYWNNSC